jgi:hypothetical protein
LAACVTTTVRPAIVSEPKRCEVDGLGVMLNATEPLPDPVAPDVTVIHGELLTAVHAQPEVVVTDAELFPPLALAASVVGETVKLHEIPFCVTENV